MINYNMYSPSRLFGYLNNTDDEDYLVVRHLHIGIHR